jgi:probable HAF family extracellular repeat protein
MGDATMWLAFLPRSASRTSASNQGSRLRRAKKRQNVARHRAHFVARLESLEGRTLLSVGGYNFQTIDDPLGVNGTGAEGINDRGQIVGVYFDANNVQHGFLLSGGQYTTLDDPNAGTGMFQGTFAHGISARGQIVGVYADSNNVFHGFLLSGGQYTTLDVPNALGTAAYGINARGQIVGGYTDASNVNHGFLLSGGQYTTLDVPNAFDTGALGINASGQIVGEYNGLNYGFLLNGGQYTTLSDTNGIFSFAQGINASRTIAGSYLSPNFVVHGYVLSGGQYTTLDDPSAGTGVVQGTYARGINDPGSIVGEYYDTNSVEHGYLATPVHGDGPALAGAVAVGATGRDGIGGGRFAGAGGSAWLPQTTITADTAMGALPGTGCRDGEEIGSGFYLATGDSVFHKKTKAAGNFASTSSDDLYGAVTII